MRDRDERPVGGIDLDGTCGEKARGVRVVERRVEAQRNDAEASDRLIDQFGRSPGRDDSPVIDDDRARAPRLGLLEMVGREQQ